MNTQMVGKQVSSQCGNHPEKLTVNPEISVIHERFSDSSFCLIVYPDFSVLQNALYE